ncbi:MAG: rhomboid family intramembrane serine protease [Actinomycetota bacterium]|nr:rhomboid family intramembrane serine protease [Actinomycetota bacterium]
MFSLIPISDANPTRRFPVVTIALILINIALFFQEPGLGTGTEATLYFYRNAPVPCQMVDQCPVGMPGPDAVPLSTFAWSLLFSTFLHGGFLHIGGNMLFLWVFGNNVEDHLGRVKYLAFYLLGGMFAALAHVAWALRDIGGAAARFDSCLLQAVGECAPPSAYVPAVGASGAVAAVMGAYLLLFPKARIKVLVPIFILWTIVQMSAWVVLGLWFLFQFVTAAQEAYGATEVAWMAHVGGFVYGAVIIYLLGGRPQRPPPMLWQPGYR